MNFFFPIKDNEKHIFFPRRVSNSYGGFKSLLEFYHELKDESNASIIVDFQNTVWVDANLCAIIGAIFVDIIVKRDNKLAVKSMSDRIEQIFLKNGFLTFFSLGSKEDVYNTTVRFSVFKSDERLSFQKYLDEELFPKIQEGLIMDDLYKDSLCSNLDEIYQNARIHGNTDRIFVCGQWYPKDNKLQFTIVDLGVTIFENVRKLDPSITPSGAIAWATIKGHTTKPSRMGGRGLHDIQEFLNKNDGMMHIISHKGYYGSKWNENYLDENEFDVLFPGTIVNITINMNDGNLYVKDFEEFFDIVTDDPLYDIFR